VLDLKKQIWKVPTLPKIRTFLWRAASGALAVAECLTAHGMPVDLTCKLCNQGSETIKHVFFQCTKAQELWTEFDVIPSQNVQNADLVELLNGCLHIMEDSNMELVRRRAIPWMLWTIWKNRNSLLYAEVQESTLLLAHIALEASTLWNELNKVEQGGNQYLHDLGAPEKWAPPAPGLVKCNMHANWRNDRYLTGGAWITRDHRGEFGMHTRDALL